MGEEDDRRCLAPHIRPVFRLFIINNHPTRFVILQKRRLPWLKQL